MEKTKKLKKNCASKGYTERCFIRKEMIDYFQQGAAATQATPTTG